MTATVSSDSPSSARASAQTTSSPLTSATGQPQRPQSAALMPTSPTAVSPNRSSCQLVLETVCESTPRAEPAIACIPIISAASQPRSSGSVYSVQALCTTNSQRSSSRSAISELNEWSPPAPWQSMTTMSVAPAAAAPRTAALISSV